MVKNISGALDIINSQLCMEKLFIFLQLYKLDQKKVQHRKNKEF